MADDPIGDFLEGLGETAEEVVTELSEGDLEGAAQAVEQGVTDSGTHVEEAATAVGDAAEGAVQTADDWVQAHQLDLPEVSGDIGIEVLGQHIGVEGSVAYQPGEGATWSAEVETPLGTREISGEAGQSGYQSSTSAEGVFGSDETSVDISTVGPGIPAGITVEHESSSDVGGMHLGSTEGSFHVGQEGGDAEGGEGPGVAVDAGPETGEGVVQAQIGIAANLAASTGQPLIQTGQYAASPGESGAEAGGTESGVTADAGVTEGAVGVEPGTQARPGEGSTAPAGEELVAVVAEPTEPAAVLAGEPSETVDEVGVSVGVVGDETVAAVSPSSSEEGPVAVAAETTEPEAVLAQESGEAVDEVGAPTGVAAAATATTVHLAGGEAEAAVGEEEPQAVAAETTEPEAVPAQESGEAVDEVGAPTGVAAAATATTVHLPGDETPAAGDEEPQAVAAETTEPEAVLWDETGGTADTGVEDTAVAAEDDEGGIGDILKDAAGAVGDFIEDVVEKIEDIFDGD